MQYPMVQRAAFLFLACAWVVLAGCSVSRETSMTERTPLEQILLTQSLERSLDEVALPLPPGATVTIATVGITADEDEEYAQELIRTWFRRQGFMVLEDDADDAAYDARITLHAFATEKSDAFFGIPPIQSVFIPLATPELTFYRKLRLRGVTRFTIDLFDHGKPTLVGTPKLYEAAVNFNRTTVLFIFTTSSTDLIPPPI